MIKDGIQQLRELHYALDGQVFNKTSGQWEAATSATQAAAQTAIDGTIKELIAMLPPVSLLGITIPQASVQTAATRIVGLLRVYFTATTR